MIKMFRGGLLKNIEMSKFLLFFERNKRTHQLANLSPMIGVYILWRLPAKKIVKINNLLKRLLWVIFSIYSGYYRGMHLTNILVSIFHANIVNFSNRLFGKYHPLFEVQSLFSHEEVIIKVDSSFDGNTWEKIPNEDVFLFDGDWRGRKVGCNCFPGTTFWFEKLLNKRKK